MPILDAIGTSIGVEIEVPNFSERQAVNLVGNTPSLRHWRAVHDGSVQRPSLQLTDSFLPIGELINSSDEPDSDEEYSVNAGRRLISRVTLGTEFVSPILDTSQTGWDKGLRDLMGILSDSGMELDKTLSFHTHVNARAVPSYILQNIVNLWMRTEAAIYRLSIGELGYHRGEQRKDFLYCRPLSSPLVIISDDRFRYCYNVKSMLKATTLEEFFAAYGMTPTREDGSKYVPQRYSGLNFYSYVNLGSVEFRTFNMTNNVEYMLAWIGLCQAFIKTAFGKPVIEPPLQPLGSRPQDFNLMDLRFMLELPDSIMPALESLWNRTAWIDYANTPIFTHLPQASRINWPKRFQKFMPEAISTPVKFWRNEEDFRMYESVSELRESE